MDEEAKSEITQALNTLFKHNIDPDKAKDLMKAYEGARVGGPNGWALYREQITVAHEAGLAAKAQGNQAP